MSDTDLHRTISDLVSQEHELRAQLAAGTIDAETEHARLAELEKSLDQVWDLLRQREARRNAGENPDDAQERPSSQVEGYLS